MAHYVYDTRLFSPQAEALVAGMGDPALINCRTGQYTVAIYINDVLQGTRTIPFMQEKAGCLRPQWTPKLLKTLGVNLPHILPVHQETPLPGGLAEYVSGAQEKFDVKTQSLYLTFPLKTLQDAQYALSRTRWDEGEPAVLMGYQYNGQQTRDHQGGQRGSYLGLDEGVNVGPWRLRGQTSRIQYRSAVTWTFFNNRLERDVLPLNSRLLLGDGVSHGDVFPSLPFYGVRLFTSEAMLPYRLRHPSPVIHGTTASPSRVTVTQNGNIIYSDTLPPGPFTISDLRTNGTGDLLVSVKAQNGDVKLFTVANTQLPVMMAEGAFKYEAIAGRSRSGTAAWKRNGQPFTLFTSAYGASSMLTLYGGLITAEYYTVPALGFSLPVPYIGALSLDLSAASAKVRAGSVSGKQYAVRYARSFFNGRTTLNVNALHRTRRFYTLSEADDARYSGIPLTSGMPSDEMQFEITHSAGAKGYLNGGLSTRGYRRSGLRSRSASLGYAYYHQGAILSFNYQLLSDVTFGQRALQRMFSLSLSLPLSTQSDETQARGYATYNLYDEGHHRVQSAGVNGTLERFTWSAEQGLNGADLNNINMQYNADKLSSSAGYYQSGDARSLNYGLSGGVVAHQHGVNFARSMGGAVTILRVGHIKGAHLIGGGEAATDSQGEVVAPWLLPYQRNTFSIDPDTLPEGARVQEDSINVYPTQGAFIFRDIAATEGSDAIFKVSFKGIPVSFGAVARVYSGGNTLKNPPFIVGGGGILYLTGVAPAGKILIQWEGKECSFAYKLIKSSRGRHVKRVDCR